MKVKEQLQDIQEFIDKVREEEKEEFRNSVTDAHHALMFFREYGEVDDRLKEFIINSPDSYVEYAEMTQERDQLGEDRLIDWAKERIRLSNEKEEKTIAEIKRGIIPTHYRNWNFDGMSKSEKADSIIGYYKQDNEKRLLQIVHQLINRYIRTVVKGRWERAERIIFQNLEAKDRYMKYLEFLINGELSKEEHKKQTEVEIDDLWKILEEPKLRAIYNTMRRNFSPIDSSKKVFELIDLVKKAG